MIPEYPVEVQYVFGWFGAASHNAQMFEGDLISLHLLQAALKGKGNTSEQLRATETVLTRQTLGVLVRELSPAVPVSPEVQQLWERALALRNELAHGFFWKNHARLLTAFGCDDLSSELRGAAQAFGTASEAAQAAMDTCVSLLRIDQQEWNQRIQQELARMAKHDDTTTPV